MKLQTGILIFIFGVIWYFFSYQTWFIQWWQKRLPIDENTIKKSEKKGAFVLIIIGILNIIAYFIL